MRKFNISVNGTAYEVEVEEIFDGASTSAPKAAAPVAPKAAAPKPVQAAKPAVAPSARGGLEMKAPMPGTINAIKVANGQSVKKGDVIFVLEAMKLENDIVSPADGVINVCCTKGDMVVSGAVLATIA